MRRITTALVSDFHAHSVRWLSMITYPHAFVFPPPTVLTKSQRAIFEKVQAWVLEHRQPSSPAPPLALPNDFPARDRQFINALAADLHLSVRWDEYNENDVNLVTWRFPGALGEGGTRGSGDGEVGGDDGDVHQQGVNGNADADKDAHAKQKEDEEDDAEARAAVERVLKKYGKAPIEDLDAQGTFDERHQRSIKEKMDEWKRGYYQVCFILIVHPRVLCPLCHARGFMHRHGALFT